MALLARVIDEHVWVDQVTVENVGHRVVDQVLGGAVFGQVSVTLAMP